MEINNKELTNEEILRQQLELLAERSKKVNDVDLPALTDSMVKVYEALNNRTVN